MEEGGNCKGDGRARSGGEERGAAWTCFGGGAFRPMSPSKAAADGALKSSSLRVVVRRSGEVDDNYNSKHKGLKNFKENLASFWDFLVLGCQNGPLFDQVLFEKCMDYVIALSCSPPRIYRQVATLVGLQLVAPFISVAKTLSRQQEITQRQLNAAKKKINAGPRVESLNKRL